MVEMWSTTQYDILCRNYLGVLLWVAKFYFCNEITLVGYNSLCLLCLCIAENPYEKLWLISLSASNNTTIVPKIWGFPLLVW